MGPKQTTIEKTERKYWQKKNQELWQNSKTHRQIRRMLMFLSNFDEFKFSLTTLHAKAYPLMFSILNNKNVSSLSLQGMDISIDSYKDLRQAVEKQKNLKALRLSFEAKEHQEVKYHLNQLGKTIACKPTLMYLTLGNWERIEQLELDGTILAEIISNTKLRGLTIQKLEIPNFHDFTNALAKSLTIRSICMQSDSEFSKDEVKSIYAALADNQKIKRLDIQDKDLHPQFDWGAFAKLIGNNRKMRELKINGDNLVSSGFLHEFCTGLEKNTGLKKIMLNNFVKSLLSKHTAVLKAVQWHKTLESFSISSNKVDEDIVIIGLCRIIEVCPKLSELLMVRIFHDKEQSRGAINPLIDEIKTKKNIKIVDLSLNLFREDEEISLIDLIAADSEITDLTYAKNTFSDKTLAAIFKALSNNKTITNFDVRFQNKKCGDILYPETGKMIAECLKINKVLKNLHINGNDFTDESFIEIAKSISQNKALNLLDLTYAGKSEIPIKTLGNALKTNEKIEKFCLEILNEIDCTPLFESLEFNKNILSMEIQGVYFTKSSLITLGKSLKNNNILKVLKMVGAFEKGGAAPFSEGLSENKGIQYISLTNSGISRSESIKFLEFLKTNKTINFLQLYYQVVELEDSDIKVLSEILEHNKTLKCLSMTCSTLTEKGIAMLKKLERKHFWLKIEIF